MPRARATRSILRRSASSRETSTLATPSGYFGYLRGSAAASRRARDEVHVDRPGTEPQIPASGYGWPAGGGVPGRTCLRIAVSQIA